MLHFSLLRPVTLNVYTTNGDYYHVSGNYPHCTETTQSEKKDKDVPSPNLASPYLIFHLSCKFFPKKQKSDTSKIKTSNSSGISNTCFGNRIFLNELQFEYSDSAPLNKLLEARWLSHHRPPYSCLSTVSNTVVCKTESKLHSENAQVQHWENTVCPTFYNVS